MPISIFTNNSSLGSYVEKDSSNPYCCKICKKGKAGDSCINKNYTCRKPPGCACKQDILLKRHIFFASK